MKLANAIAVLGLLTAMILSPLAKADSPSVCISLTPQSSGTGGTTTASDIKLDLYASNKPGSVSTFYGLNGSASSTQGTGANAKELFFLVSGTGYVTTKNAIEASVLGTAIDTNCDCTKTQGAATCECARESMFHVVIDGTNNRYTQIVRSPAEQSEVVVRGTAAMSQDCGKKK